jgi:hypothetical protein
MNVLVGGISFEMQRWSGTDWTSENDALGPRSLLTLHIGDGNSLAAVGGQIYVAWTGNGLDVQGNPRAQQTMFRGGIATSASEQSASTDHGLELEPPRPNPFDQETEFSFRIPGTSGLSGPSPTTLRVYNSTGRLVRELMDEPCQPGIHTARWDGRDDGGNKVASGVYFARLEHKSEGRTTRLVLLK